MRTFSARTFILLGIGVFALDAGAQNLTGIKTMKHGQPSLGSTVLSTSANTLAQGLRGTAPLNDECFGATAIIAGATCTGTFGDMTGATQTLAPSTCSSFLSSAAYDVWFSFTATGTTTTAAVAGGGDATTGLDPILEIYSGTCGALTSLGCSDTSVRAGTEALTVSTSPGTTYYYRVYYWIYAAGTTAFNYGTCVISTGGGAGPANDFCANATSIAPGAACTPVNGDATGATQSLAPSTCSTFTSTAANDVWFTFVATGTTTTVGVGGGGDATTGYDPILEIYSGNCGALSSLGCSDTSVRAGVEALTIPTTIGTTYYYRIYYWNYATAQTVFNYATCVVSGGGGTGPINDDCANVTATNLTIPGNITFTGDNSTAIPGGDGILDAGGDTTTVWHAFTTTACSNVTISFCNSATVSYIYWAALFDACPADANYVLSSSNDFTTCANGAFTMTFDQLPAGTYYLPVRGEPATAGAYTIDVTSTSCGGGNTPPNDECAAVTPVNLNIGGSVVFVGDNTGATDSEGLGVASVWHSFTTTDCANITIDYCGTNPAFGNAFLNLFVGCPFTTFVAATAYETTTCANGGVTIQYNNVPAGTYYYAVLTETGSVGPYALNVSAVACAPPDNYCTAGAVSLQYEKISNVTFAGINNNSTSVAGYEDFTAVTGSVVAGSSYPISVTINAGYTTDQVLVWIDWNQSSVFDAGEIAFSSAPGIGPHTGNITVPLTAVPGPTRMRVRLHDSYTGTNYQNTPNATPCDTSTFGQVEDYTVDMIGIITGVQANTNSTWSVFPNPNNGDFTVAYAGQDGQAKFEMLDMTGRVVYAHQRAVTSGANINLTLSGDVAGGTYVLRITNGASVEEQRIVVR